MTEPPLPTDEFVRRAGGADGPVLLTGETGTGKTYLARRIHEAGARARGPFVRVNCGAIPETLFERELFGHERGAFTDARESRMGFIESADGGTLFLDEVGELPLHLQPKLLAVLEDGVFRRLGSAREARADVRVIAATNRDLRAMVRGRSFREDLYYRLSGFRHRLAPLRERPQEIPLLAAAVLARIAGPTPAPRLRPDVLPLLRAYRWPGNLRELENVLRTAAAFADGVIGREHLPPEIAGAGAGGDDPSAARYLAPSDPGAEVALIRAALEWAKGNRTHAARRLGMSRSTLWAKLHRYGDAALPAPQAGASARDP